MDGLACTHLYLAYESPVTLRLALSPRALAIAPLGLILTLFLASPSLAEAGCRVADCEPAPTEISLIEPEVVALQDDLKALGYFPEEVRSTGYYGEITRESVREFQQASGLPVDGIADRVTRDRIDRAIANMGSQAIAETPKPITTLELQYRLKTLGYFPAKVRTTGYYGPITEESVRKFQSAYGLPVNGTADSSTVAKLEEVTQHATSASRGGTMRRFSETRIAAPPTQKSQRPAGTWDWPLSKPSDGSIDMAIRQGAAISTTLRWYWQ
jgi:peptidoglycan hydrolase-like protein with peptidoglycan-binding domain